MSKRPIPPSEGGSSQEWLDWVSREIDWYAFLKSPEYIEAFSKGIQEDLETRRKRGLPMTWERKPKKQRRPRTARERMVDEYYDSLGPAPGGGRWVRDYSMEFDEWGQPK